MSVTSPHYRECPKYTNRSMEYVYATIWSIHSQQCAAGMVYPRIKCCCNASKM